MKFAGSAATENPLSMALRRCRPAMLMVGVASALVNLLYLTSSFFMLQVYDRVIPSKSIPSLIALGVLALMLYGFQAAFEITRSRILVRISNGIDSSANDLVFRSIVEAPVRGSASVDGLSAMRDVDQIRSFAAGAGPSAFFDLPWMPFYVAICFLFHPLIGFVTIFGACMLVLLTFLSHQGTRSSVRETYETVAKRNAVANAASRNVEVVRAMGMGFNLSQVWSEYNDQHRNSFGRNADRVNFYSTVSKIFRAVLQSAVLATGAVLVIKGMASGGIIIAASILTSRALAPVEQVIANWRSMIASQQSWKRLQDLAATLNGHAPPLLLPPPVRDISVESLVGGPPGGQEVIISGLNFTVKAGSALGVIGSSASGKSSLARTLIGLWPAYRGTVRIDGAAIEQWERLSLGRHIGYLPQEIELFAGTVAQNIARFDTNPSPTAVISAAQTAGVHEMILRLPDGYETRIGENGTGLSAGQRQRIALARALYGDPFLVVLDEPNSNLDVEGEAALSSAIMHVRNRGGIAIVVAHRPSALASVDLVLAMNGGTAAAFGSKSEVLSAVLKVDPRGAATIKAPLKVVSDQKE